MHSKSRRAETQAATQARDHYAEVTDQIIAALEAGTPPWRMPWDPAKATGPSSPRNAATGAAYRGINFVTLGMSPLAFTTGDPRWATYKQAAERGWQVKKGSRGTTGFFYKRIEVRDTKRSDDDEGTKLVPLLRSFTVFHASQIEGIPECAPPTVEEAPWRAPEAADTIVTNSRAVVHFGGDRAFYSPVTDHIQMPPPSSFHSAAMFASVILHEMAHWTGDATRLNRDLRNSFGSYEYSMEELRAEIATVMVCSETNIPEYDFSNNASYIAHWLARLRSDRKEIFRAAADAQRIADYLLSFHPDYAKRHRDTPETSPAGDDSTIPTREDDTNLARAA